MDYFKMSDERLKAEARGCLAQIANLKQELKERKAQYDAIIAVMLRNGEEEEE